MLKKLKLKGSMKTYKTSRTNTPKRCPFHYRGLECKSRNSRDICCNRQIWLGKQNEAGQRLTEFCQENSLVIANTLFQQHKRRLYSWTSPDGQYRNQIDYIHCSQRWRSSIQSAKTRPEADCGLDQFSSVQLLSCPTLCNPINRSVPGLPVNHHPPEFTQIRVIELVMPSSHLILCCPLLLLPPIPPSIRVFSNQSTLCMR